jgi:hypothetical protein
MKKDTESSCAIKKQLEMSDYVYLKKTAENTSSIMKKDKESSYAI